MRSPSSARVTRSTCCASPTSMTSSARSSGAGRCAHRPRCRRHRRVHRWRRARGRDRGHRRARRDRRARRRLIEACPTIRPRSSSSSSIVGRSRSATRSWTPAASSSRTAGSACRSSSARRRTASQRPRRGLTAHDLEDGPASGQPGVGLQAFVLGPVDRRGDAHQSSSTVDRRPRLQAQRPDPEQAAALVVGLEAVLGHARPFDRGPPRRCRRLGRRVEPRPDLVVAHRDRAGARSPTRASSNRPRSPSTSSHAAGLPPPPSRFSAHSTPRSASIVSRSGWSARPSSRRAGSRRPPLGVERLARRDRRRPVAVAHAALALEHDVRCRRRPSPNDHDEVAELLVRRPLERLGRRARRAGRGRARSAARRRRTRAALEARLGRPRRCRGSRRRPGRRVDPSPASTARSVSWYASGRRRMTDRSACRAARMSQRVDAAAVARPHADDLARSR